MHIFTLQHMANIFKLVGANSGSRESRAPITSTRFFSLNWLFRSQFDHFNQ